MGGNWVITYLLNSVWQLTALAVLAVLADLLTVSLGLAAARAEAS